MCRLLDPQLHFTYNIFISLCLKIKCYKPALPQVFCFHWLFQTWCSVLLCAFSSCYWTAVAEEMCFRQAGSTIWHWLVRLDYSVWHRLPLKITCKWELFKFILGMNYSKKNFCKVRWVSLLDVLNIITSFWHFPRGQFILLPVPLCRDVRARGQLQPTQYFSNTLSCSSLL